MEQVKKIITALVILGIGILIMMFFIKTKELPQEQVLEKKIPAVEVFKAVNSESNVVVSASGNVVAAKRLVVIPEVSGKVIYHHKNLLPGGKIKKGETVLRIDPRDYDLNVIQQKSNVALAEVQLTTEKGLKVVAEKEWNQISGQVQPTEEGSQLAKRDLQVKSAEKSLEAAQSGLELATLRRKRTSIRSPFNAVVINESIEKGQFVGVGSQTVTLVDMDTFWVRVSLPADQLQWINIPGVQSDKGSDVCVIQQNGFGKEIRRRGKVKMLMTELEAQGRMARIIVEVPNPLSVDPAVFACEGDQIDESVSDDNSSIVPLLLNDFVSVEITGKQFKNSVIVPRSAIRGNEKVWVLTADSTMDIRPITIGFRQSDSVYVTTGVSVGERVITSRIKIPVKGMKLKTNGSLYSPKKTSKASLSGKKIKDTNNTDNQE